MTNFRPHPLPFTSKDPRMQDPKGENVEGGDTNLNHFSEAIFSCPIVVATEPVYALARQIKKAKQKRHDKKEAEAEDSASNAKKEKWYADDKEQYSDSEGEQHIRQRAQRDGPWAPDLSQTRMEQQRWAETQARLRLCTPERPGYHKDQCLAHEKKQPQESSSSGTSAN
uniref:WGS project CBMI000000000 data, contig CS3069_c003358 n=1 Tax=Fusarium clavum TaxID=2594811 RepID=A0A090N5W7_9HYPO|nr:unnamed protein product [Fusarium clavum]